MAEKKPGLISRLFGARKQKTISDVTSDTGTSQEAEASKAKRLNRLFSVDATTFRDKEDVYSTEFKNPECTKEPQTSDDGKNRRPSSAGSKKTSNASAAQKAVTATSPRAHGTEDEASQKVCHKSKSQQSGSTTKSEVNPDSSSRQSKSSIKTNGKETRVDANLTRRKSAGAALSRSSNSSSSSKDPTSPTKSSSSSRKSSGKESTSTPVGSPTKSSTKSPTSSGASPPVFDEDQPLLATPIKENEHKSSSSPNKARRASKPKISSTRKGSLQTQRRDSDEQPQKSSPTSVSGPAEGPEEFQRPIKPKKAIAAKALRRKKANKSSGVGAGGGVKVDTSKPLSFPATPETIYEYHRQKPFLDRNEEWLMVELNEYECLVDSIDIIKIIAKHSKFFEVEPDELWVEFFEFVEEVPSYDEIINYDVWQEFRDQRYPC